MSTKSINIDPNILNINGNKKTRKNNTTKKNQLNIPIKNTDIYTLITNRLKNKNSQDDPNSNNPFKQTKDPIINIKNDIDYVQQMLQHTKSKKNINNKIRKPFSYNVDGEVPWGNMKNGLKKTFREWKKTSQTIHQPNKTSSTIQFSSDLIQPLVQNPIQPSIQSQIQPSIQPLIQPQIQPSIQPLIQPLMQPSIQPLIQPSIQPPMKPIKPLIQEPILTNELNQNQMVPVKINKKIKKTIHNKYKLGKQKNRQIPRVGILLKTPNTRKTIIEECKKLKSEDISQIKTYLRKRGFIREGSIAPPNVIRELYCSLKTTGEVKNTNKEYTMDDLHSADK
jgi:hypothetical protein